MKNLKITKGILAGIGTTGTIAAVAGGALIGYKATKVADANTTLKGNDYALGGQLGYSDQLDRGTITSWNKKEISLNKDKKVNYLALGDSVAAGYDAWRDIDGYGYVDFVHDELKAKGKLGDFDKETFTGMTGQDMGSIIEGNMSESTWDSVLNDHKYTDEAKYANSKNSDKHVSFSEYSKGIDQKIKDANLITLNMGANDILAGINVFGIPAHDLLNPTYLKKKNLVPESVTAKDAMSYYIGNKVSELKAKGLMYIAKHLDEIVKIDKKKLAKIIINVGGYINGSLARIRRINPDANVVVAGYYNPLANLGVIGKLAGVEDLIGNLNLAIKNAVYTQNIKQERWNVIFSDFSAITATPTRTKNYNKSGSSTFEEGQTYGYDANSEDDFAKSVPSQIFIPHILDIHPSLKGSIMMGKMILTDYAMRTHMPATHEWEGVGYNTKLIGMLAHDAGLDETKLTGDIKTFITNLEKYFGVSSIKEMKDLGEVAKSQAGVEKASAALSAITTVTQAQVDAAKATLAKSQADFKAATTDAERWAVLQANPAAKAAISAASMTSYAALAKALGTTPVTNWTLNKIDSKFDAFVAAQKALTNALANYKFGISYDDYQKIVKSYKPTQISAMKEFKDTSTTDKAAIAIQKQMKTLFSSSSATKAQITAKTNAEAAVKAAAALTTAAGTDAPKLAAAKTATDAAAKALAKASYETLSDVVNNEDYKMDPGIKVDSSKFTLNSKEFFTLLRYLDINSDILTLSNPDDANDTKMANAIKEKVNRSSAVEPGLNTDNTKFEYSGALYLFDNLYKIQSLNMVTFKDNDGNKLARPTKFADLSKINSENWVDVKNIAFTSYLNTSNFLAKNSNQLYAMYKDEDGYFTTTFDKVKEQLIPDNGNKEDEARYKNWTLGNMYVNSFETVAESAVKGLLNSVSQTVINLLKDQVKGTLESFSKTSPLVIGKESWNDYIQLKDIYSKDDPLYVLLNILATHIGEKFNNDPSDHRTLFDVLWTNMEGSIEDNGVSGLSIMNALSTAMNTIIYPIKDGLIPLMEGKGTSDAAGQYIATSLVRLKSDISLWTTAFFDETVNPKTKVKVGVEHTIQFYENLFSFNEFGFRIATQDLPIIGKPIESLMQERDEVPISLLFGGQASELFTFDVFGKITKITDALKAMEKLDLKGVKAGSDKEKAIKADYALREGVTKPAGLGYGFTAGYDTQGSDKEKANKEIFDKLVKEFITDDTNPSGTSYPAEIYGS